MTFRVIPDCETASKEVETKADAQDAQDTHEALCEQCSKGDVVIESMEEAVEAEPVPDTQETVEPETSGTEEYDLPDKPPVDTDPLTWIPDEFQDRIDGTVAINRKGFEVLAHHYNISCKTDMVEFSGETVVHKAIAETDDGTVYTAYGEAHADADDSDQLVRMSDTRAYKRCVSRATGIGMVAVSELQDSL